MFQKNADVFQSEHYEIPKDPKSIIQATATCHRLHNGVHVLKHVYKGRGCREFQEGHPELRPNLAVQMKRVD